MTEAIPQGKPAEKDEAERTAQLEAEFDALMRTVDDGGEAELQFHPYLLAQAFAVQRRDLRAQFLALATAARVRRKMKDHSRAEQFFADAKKQWEGVVAVEDLVAEESEAVQGFYAQILKEWDRQIAEQAEAEGRRISAGKPKPARTVEKPPEEPPKE